MLPCIFLLKSSQFKLDINLSFVIVFVTCKIYNAFDKRGTRGRGIIHKGGEILATDRFKKISKRIIDRFYFRTTESRHLEKYSNYIAPRLQRQEYSNNKSDVSPNYLKRFTYFSIHIYCVGMDQCINVRAI